MKPAAVERNTRSRAMLRRAEVSSGTVFVLKLWDAVGVSSQWAETLRGDAAERWYDIHRRSDWGALRAEAAGVFRNPVTEAEAAGLIRRAAGRCVFIHTLLVEAAQLAAPPVRCWVIPDRCGDLPRGRRLHPETQCPRHL